jgi:hypothetical protein
VKRERFVRRALIARRHRIALRREMGRPEEPRLEHAGNPDRDIDELPDSLL